MARKITTEVWLSERTEEQRSKFDYSKVIYTGAHNKVTLTCKKCSTEFQQAAGSHASGCGCKVCAQAEGGKTQKITQDQFLKHCEEVHGTRYDYSLVNYKNSLTKVDIICPREGHGVFSILPPGHTHAGGGCPVCAQEARIAKTTKTQDRFIEQCVAQNAPKITFEKVVYKGDRPKVEFNCADHGSFFMAPYNFLQGQRCPSCSANGYSHARPGRFYILSDGATTKVGVTHRNPQKRADAVYHTGGPQMSVITSLYFEDGSIPTKIESACLKYLKAKYEQVTQVFDGYTECFLDVDVKDLLNFITPIAALPETI